MDLRVKGEAGTTYSVTKKIWGSNLRLTLVDPVSGPGNKSWQAVECKG